MPTCTRKDSSSAGTGGLLRARQRDRLLTLPFSAIPIRAGVPRPFCPGVKSCLWSLGGPAQPLFIEIVEQRRQTIARECDTLPTDFLGPFIVAGFRTLVLGCLVRYFHRKMVAFIRPTLRVHHSELLREHLL